MNKVIRHALALAAIFICGASDQKKSTDTPRGLSQSEKNMPLSKVQFVAKANFLKLETIRLIVMKKRILTLDKVGILDSRDKTSIRNLNATLVKTESFLEYYFNSPTQNEEMEKQIKERNNACQELLKACEAKTRLRILYDQLSKLDAEFQAQIEENLVLTKNSLLPFTEKLVLPTLKDMRQVEVDYAKRMGIKYDSDFDEWWDLDQFSKKASDVIRMCFKDFIITSKILTQGKPGMKLLIGSDIIEKYKAYPLASQNPYFVHKGTLYLGPLADREKIMQQFVQSLKENDYVLIDTK